jgi:hypothetical protein
VRGQGPPHLLGESRCTLLREQSQLALPRLPTDGVVADAAFVDGSHVFHNVFVDLYFLRELVRPGGLIVLDDCDWPSVATAVQYDELNAGWRPDGRDLPPRLAPSGCLNRTESRGSRNSSPLDCSRQPDFSGRWAAKGSAADSGAG